MFFHEGQQDAMYRNCHQRSSFKRVLAAADVRDYVWRTGARLNLPLAWLPDRIASGRFALEEPPSRPSDWVSDVLRQARVFAQRLDHMPSLNCEDVELVSWTI